MRFANAFFDIAMLGSVNTLSELTAQSTTSLGCPLGGDAKSAMVRTLK